MCGIVYKESFKGEPVNQAIAQLYKNQRNRGIDGFGFYIPKFDRLSHNTQEKKILDLLGRVDYTADRILFHHRYPTSTDNVQNACHPFSTRRNASLFDNEYVMVHNGHIGNASKLKEAHEKLGIKYVSVQPDGKFNDSEALLYDLALYLEGKQEKLEATGGIAFIVTSGDNLWFGHNASSPLKMNMTSRGLTLSSEGSGEAVEIHKLYEFNRERKAFTTRDLTIGYKFTSNSGTYSDSSRHLNWSYPSSTYDEDIARHVDTKREYDSYDDYVVTNKGRQIQLLEPGDDDLPEVPADVRTEVYELMDFFNEADQALNYIRGLQRIHEDRVDGVDTLVMKTQAPQYYEAEYYLKALAKVDHYQQMINFIEELVIDGDWDWGSSAATAGV